MIDLTTLPSLPLSQRKDLPRVTGIYFVCDVTGIIYIGQSENIRRRWMSHCKLKALSNYEEVKIYWMQINVKWGTLDRQNLLQKELDYIHYFKPVLNNPQQTRGVFIHEYTPLTQSPITFDYPRDKTPPLDYSKLLA